MMFPRVKGHEEYLSALDDGVRQFLTGTQSAQATLESVAETWDSVTDKIGREAQIKEFKRESGF
jgi:multiple sugar transport system substrate-binding protein